jgi:hypothetical protein
MCAAIETPGKCEIRTAICFLQAEAHSAAEIHRRMSAVHGPNFMSDKSVREWCRNKKRGVLTSGVVLLHDNACPHTAAHTQALIQKFYWDLFDRPPYSPDLAPSDFHLFLRMKVWLGTQRLRVKANEELMDSVKDLLISHPAGNFL